MTAPRDTLIAELTEALRELVPAPEAEAAPAHLDLAALAADLRAEAEQMTNPYDRAKYNHRAEGVEMAADHFGDAHNMVPPPPPVDRDSRDAELEEAAQVADEYGKWFIARQIAKRIRSLKSSPVRQPAPFWIIEMEDEPQAPCRRYWSGQKGWGWGIEDGYADAHISEWLPQFRERLADPALRVSLTVDGPEDGEGTSYGRQFVQWMADECARSLAAAQWMHGAARKLVEPYEAALARSEEENKRLRAALERITVEDVHVDPIGCGLADHVEYPGAAIARAALNASTSEGR